MKRRGLAVAVMVATVVMALTVSTYAITARAVNPIVGLSFQGTTAVCHGSGKGTISLSGTCRVETGKQYKLILTYSINGNTKAPVTTTAVCS